MKFKEPEMIPLQKFPDQRGWLAQYLPPSGRTLFECAQINISESGKGVFRGLHYSKVGQEKFVTCIRGSLVDFCVPVDPSHPQFGRSWMFELSDELTYGIFVPKGFAHGFLSLETGSRIMYALSSKYEPEHESGINWRGSPMEESLRAKVDELGIPELIESPKDRAATRWEGKPIL